jgi:hypothetical protein
MSTPRAGEQNLAFRRLPQGSAILQLQKHLALFVSVCCTYSLSFRFSAAPFQTNQKLAVEEENSVRVEPLRPTRK